MLRCPRCGQQAARRSRRAGFRDHLLGAVHLYPFRCQLCTARFRVFQARQPHFTDRREYDRLLVKIPVTLAAGAVTGAGETIDLALSGCSLRTAAAFDIGTTVRLRLKLGQAGDVEVQAAVVRTAGADGLGLVFVRIAPPDHERLSHYLGRFLRPTGTPPRRAGRPRPELVVAAAVGIGVILVVFLLMARLGGPPVR